jgi:2'-5' RNA ligase
VMVGSRAAGDDKVQSHHATIFLAPSLAEPIEAIRRAWDPFMAAQIAAHVTLVYPEEAPCLAHLVACVRTASSCIAPFRLRLGGVAHFGRPEDGVYIAVEDVDGGYRDAREAILRPPCTPLVFSPHVTLVHPRTASRGRACWEQVRSQGIQLEFTAEEVAIADRRHPKPQCAE